MGYPVDKSKGSEFKKKSEQDYEGTRKSIVDQYKSKSMDYLDELDKSTRRGRKSPPMSPSGRGKK